MLANNNVINTVGDLQKFLQSLPQNAKLDLVPTAAETTFEYLVIHSDIEYNAVENVLTIVI